jgi:hypothetical protein
MLSWQSKTMPISGNARPRTPPSGRLGPCTDARGRGVFVIDALRVLFLFPTGPRRSSQRPNRDGVPRCWKSGRRDGGRRRPHPSAAFLGVSAGRGGHPRAADARLAQGRRSGRLTSGYGLGRTTGGSSGTATAAARAPDPDANAAFAPERSPPKSRDATVCAQSNPSFPLARTAEGG